MTTKDSDQMGELLSTYNYLTPAEKTVMRMKALIAFNTTKTIFLAAMVATRSVGNDGKPWSSYNLNPVLNNLIHLGLLDENGTCNKIVLHPIAAEAGVCADGPKLAQIIRDHLPVTGRTNFNRYSYNMQLDMDAIRHLRLTFYMNDEVEYRRMMELYDKYFSSLHGEHILERFFLGIDVGVDWLTSRVKPIQSAIFFAKLYHFLETGIPAVDLAPLLVHYQRMQDDPDYQNFQLGLLPYDILAGNLAKAETKITTLPIEPIYGRLKLQGTLSFLTGHNDQALAQFGESLKLYKKASSKRKIFIDDTNGLFYLMALFMAHDATLYPTIQTHLDAVEYDDNPCSNGFSAMHALLWLMQGQDAKARDLLVILRNSMPSEPLSAACVVLVERLMDIKLARKFMLDTAMRFQQLKTCLPLVARIHAEVLTQLGEKDYTEQEIFLKTSHAGQTIIDFTGIIHLREPWERAMENLSAFLRSGSTRPTVTDQAPRPAKRLAWFLDLEKHTIEVLEQSPKGRNGWTPGRSVAMKRFYEHDPNLNYLTDHDQRALRTIQMETYGWHNEKIYSFHPYKTILALIGHPLIFNARQREQRVELVSYPVELIVKEQRNSYQMTLSHVSDTPSVFLEPETPTRYRVIEISPQVLALRDILGSKGLTVPHRAKEQVLDLVLEQHPLLPIRAEISAVDLPAREGDATPTLQLQPFEEGLKVNLVVRPFGVEGPCYLVGQGGHSVLALLQGQQQRVNRDLNQERSSAALIVGATPTLVRLGEHNYEWMIPDLDSSLELLLELNAIPHPVRLEWPEGERLRVSPSVSTKNLSLKISRARDWFHLEGSIQLDEELVLDMQDLLSRMDQAKGRFIPLADGRFLTLTRHFQKQLERLRSVSEEHAKGCRLPLLGTLAVRDVVEEAGSVKTDRSWQEFAARLKASGEYQPVIPSTLQAELRDYQVEGFAWMSRLASWGAGACLADDMGLGKTVQAIAVMLEQGVKGSILVVAPTSVCHNWEAELGRFAPTLGVHRLSDASDRAGLIAGLGAMEVLVASYGLLHQEADRLAEKNWQMVILDEAQAVKNAGTRRSQAGQRLQANFRLVLTGTPIENYLDELWSLFTIINPGLLGSRESFQRRFASPIERNRNNEALQILRALIRPFILRRTKSAVLSELPPRTELTLAVDLPEEERAFYEALRRKALESLTQLNVGEGGQRRIHILAEITRLRRCCCHPGLITPETELPGAKLETFLELVGELICNHHKALVFSQFVGQLERVATALDAKGIRYQYLDGSTPAKDREKRVTAFQAGEGDVFLISLKAGGTGLNLTAADYVIHLDPWWNPAVEDQASDRAHRIGQHRPVTVYRLIVRNSIEEKILQLHRHKRDLATDLLEGAEVSGRLSEDDLLDLIRM